MPINLNKTDYSFQFEPEAPLKDPFVSPANNQKNTSSEKTASNTEASVFERAGQLVKGTAEKIAAFSRILNVFALKKQTASSTPQTLPILSPKTVIYFQNDFTDAVRIKFGLNESVKQLRENSKKAQELDAIGRLRSLTRLNPSPALYGPSDPKENHLDAAESAPPSRLKETVRKAAGLGIIQLARMPFAAWGIAAVAYETFKEIAHLPLSLNDAKNKLLNEKIPTKVYMAKSASNLSHQEKRIRQKAPVLVAYHLFLNILNPLSSVVKYLPTVMGMGDKQDVFLRTPLVDKSIRSMTPINRRQNAMTPAQKKANELRQSEKP